MKKILLAILVLFIGSTAQSQVLQNAKRTFEAPNLNQILHSHKNIAILPIKFTQNYQRTPKGVVQEDLKNMDYNKGFGWQYAMFSFLLSQSENYFVTFQDPLRTNALLKKVNALDSLDSKLPDEISKILNHMQKWLPTKPITYFPVQKFYSDKQIHRILMLLILILNLRQ